MGPRRSDVAYTTWAAPARQHRSGSGRGARRRPSHRLCDVDCTNRGETSHLTRENPSRCEPSTLMLIGDASDLGPLVPLSPEEAVVPVEALVAASNDVCTDKTMFVRFTATAPGPGAGL